MANRIEADLPVVGSGAKSSGQPNPYAPDLGRILMALALTALTIVFLFAGFLFLRDGTAPKIIIAVVAIVWGVGGIAMLFTTANYLVETLGQTWRNRLQPYVFVGPAIVLLLYFLAIPTLRTFYISLFDESGTTFIGLQNYIAVFTNQAMFTAFRNNIIWIIFGAGTCVVAGLMIAVLADRSRFENLAKSVIFMPMAISMVGASIIFNFIYDIDAHTGLINAIYTGITGAQPIGWTSQLQPFNNLFLIVVMVWLQTGYSMVLFSAAIKGVPNDLLEAARVDGAGELRIFFSIVIPSIMGTIITVGTTVVIFTLKIFDVVWVMTGGQFDTQVIATQFYREYFTAQNAGYGSAIAIVLLVLVIPIMLYNIRAFNERQAF